jgi:ABC-type phosphate/phosphonate transport system permease subunit
MEKKFNDKELKMIFQASKKEIENGNFSVRVIRNLPEKQTSFVWVYILIFSVFTLIIGFSTDWTKWTESILDKTNNMVQFFSNFSMSLPNNPLIYCGLFIGFLFGLFWIIKREQSKSYLF